VTVAEDPVVERVPAGGSAVLADPQDLPGEGVPILRQLTLRGVSGADVQQPVGTEQELSAVVVDVAWDAGQDVALVRHPVAP
jgi:hypothetical protein